jgi:hypothetical protein
VRFDESLAVAKVVPDDALKAVELLVRRPDGLVESQQLGFAVGAQYSALGHHHPRFHQVSGPDRDPARRADAFEWDS